MLDAGVVAAGAISGPVTDGRACVDRVAVADHLVQQAVLGLGVPVGLDDDRLRAVAGEVDAPSPPAVGRRPSCPPSVGGRPAVVRGRRRSSVAPGRVGRASVVVVVVAAARGERERRRRAARPSSERAASVVACVAPCRVFTLVSRGVRWLGGWGIWARHAPAVVVPAADDELARASRRRRTRRCRAATATISAPYSRG